MDWPHQRVESISRFRPTHCPRRECAAHLFRGSGYRFRRKGSYSTLQQCDIPRYRCGTCRRGFSRQTFAATYYLKQRHLQPKIAAGLVAGSAHRQIARTLGVQPTTVARQAARLGRHSILLHAQTLDSLEGKVAEPFVLDHFETFEYTQDYPFGVATLVGAESWFVYGLDAVPHARTGKRTPSQRRRIAQRPHRPNRGGYVGSTKRTIDGLFRLVPAGQVLKLRGDGHHAYDTAVRRHEKKESIELTSFPNPKRRRKGEPRTPEAKARDEALFPVDLLHKILRHSGAHYRRETIAFARRVNAAMERLFLTAIWRNFVKKRSERKPCAQSPASQLGVTSGLWSWGRVLAKRLFPDRQRLPDQWEEIYWRRWKTPVLTSNAEHNPKRSY